METDLIKIGNSRGIRIPAALIKQCGLEGGLTLEVRGRSLVLKPAPQKPKKAKKRKPREGWADDFIKHGAPPIEWPEMEYDDPGNFNAEWTWPE
ncbi:MAG: AbrB/MazE/SpoVT family DNA-binding domain-containing protein [Rickettsiales bacterium]